MVAPTFEKATDTDPGSSSQYETSDEKYASDVLDDSHATDRIRSSSVIEHNNKDYDVIVYISGGTVYARRGKDGTLVSSSNISTPETAIQAAIDQAPGRIYIDGGTYNFSARFSGLNIDKAFTMVTMAPNAWLKVPSGYAGACFLLNTQRNATTGVIEGTESSLLTYATKGYQNVILEGGIIGDQAQASSQTRSWVGVRMYASYAGTFLCTLHKLHINHCLTGIELLVDNTTGSDPSNTRANQWLNSNLFENIWIWDAVIGVDFKVHASVVLNEGYGFNYNTFKHVIVQAGDGTSPYTTPTHGFKDIKGIENHFINCISFDFTGTQKRSTIHSSATNTFILGGAITDTSSNLYVDQGVETIVIDPTQTNLSKGYTAEAYNASTSINPQLVGIKSRGTKASPSTVLTDDILLELSARGYNGISIGEGGKIQVKASSDWSGTNRGTYTDFQGTPTNQTTPFTVLRLYGWGGISMAEGCRLYFGGGDGGFTTLTEWLFRPSANVLQMGAGNASIFEARSTHSLAKAFSSAADPTTTDVPPGYFTVAKNTTSGAVKLFYNDGGTLKSVTLT